VAFETLRVVLLNDVPLEVFPTVVLEQVQPVMWGVVGTGQVEIAVAIQVGGCDSIRIGVLVGDQML